MSLKTKAEIIVLTMCIVLLSASPLWAETKFSYDGQIRLRDEFDLKSFDTRRHAKTFMDLRTRVGFKFEPSNQAFAYIQLQDSRRLGDPSSGDLETTNNVDLHQAYFEATDSIWGGDIRFRGGRFELNYGNQRVFGSVGWSNVGRSWDGLWWSYLHRDFQIDFFGLTRFERNDEYYNRDFTIMGLYGKIFPASLDLFAFYEHNFDSTGYAFEKLKRVNIGGYFNRSFGDMDVTLQGVYQLGDQPQGPLPNTVLQLIRAYMFTAEAGFTIHGKYKTRLALGIDYSSGNDGSDAKRYKTYINAYYTGHKFRGYMDYFIGSDEYGLVDIVLKSKMTTSQKSHIQLDIHRFNAAEYFVSKFDFTTRTKDIGWEIDGTEVSKDIPGLTSTAGVSLFFADEHFTELGKDRKISMWFYMMFAVDF